MQSELEERSEIRRLLWPVEKVLEILNNLRDLIDPEEKKVVQELNYCIKMISSN
jgi:hypothetical protein